MVFRLNPHLQEQWGGVKPFSLPGSLDVSSPPPGSSSPSRAPELVVRGQVHSIGCGQGLGRMGMEQKWQVPPLRPRHPPKGLHHLEGRGVLCDPRRIHRGLHHLRGARMCSGGGQTRHYAVVCVVGGETVSQEDEDLNCKLSRADGHPSVGGPVQSAEDLGRTKTEENWSLL